MHNVTSAILRTHSWQPTVHICFRQCKFDWNQERIDLSIFVRQLMLLNTTFNNISVVSVEETRVPGENQIFVWKNCDSTVPGHIKVPKMADDF
jgi:hypothetical protein